MVSFHDDYEEFDELRFDDVAAARRATRETKEKHRRGATHGGRKHKRQTSYDRWSAMDWDEMDEFDDYNDVEFDTGYRTTTDH